jgi:cytochrome c oxidase subunit 4
MERDDIIEYSLDAHHSEEAGKKLRKKIYFVTILLTLITIVEIAMGIMFKRYGTGWEAIKWTFIVLTLVKAAYIVLVFMHLGDERKSLKWVILGPYILFILYLLFICLTEATYVGNVLDKFYYF